MQPDVSVVVANYAGDDVLAACLESIADQTRAPVETLVLDAGATDEVESIASRFGARVLTRPNRGLGYLYNQGALSARGQLVFLLNNDVVLEARCVELLVAELERDPGCFAADPAQLGFDGRLVHARATLRRGPFLRQPLPGFRLDLRVPAEKPVPTLCANGGAMLVRREPLVELGGFDETMFMDFEDLDLCWRAWCRGWASVHVPAATLQHRVGAATRRAGVLDARLRSSHHNLIRFALKCFPARDAALVVLGELVRLPRHPTVIAPALARIVLELPEILRERRRIAPQRALMRWMLDGQPQGAQS